VTNGGLSSHSLQYLKI